MKRRLAAILAADVVSYSRLMGEDEAGTLAALKGHRKELIDPKIAEHKGRIVKLMGDGALVEFASVVDAVNCAVEIQKAMAERNAVVPEAKRIRFRVGVNLGDVIVEGDDIYGDGVNIAARLEALAEPGEVCVSRTVFDHVRNKVAIEFEDLGERDFKNIAEPVRVYRTILEERLPSLVRPESRRGLTSLVPIGSAIVAVLALGAVLLGWWQPWKVALTPAAVERMAFPLPEKPSIAVTPFRDQSGNDIERGFVEALAEHLISTLSMLPEAFVIAKDSSFALAEAALDVHEISERLGVRYIVQGTYQSMGGKARTTAQLIDALHGRRSWSMSRDHAPEDVFAIQGKIVADIAAILQLAGNRAALATAPTSSLRAWTLHVKASAEQRNWTAELNARARGLWAEATAQDPDFALAWLKIGWTHWADVLLGWTEDPDSSFREMEASARKVLEIDPGSAGANALLAGAYLSKMDHEKALEHGHKAISLNPNDAGAFATLAIAQNFAGRPDEAQISVEAAMRLNPYYPFWYLFPQAEAYRLGGRYDDAIESVRTELRRFDHFRARTRLAIYQVQSGHEDLAKSEIRKVLDEKPRMTIAKWAKTQYFKDPARLEGDHAALKKAGLPEILSFECLMRSVCP